MRREEFLKYLGLAGFGLSTLPLWSQCKAKEKPLFFKLSLAQWSINRMIKAGDISPYEFARLAAEWGFSGLEYVSQLYVDVNKAEDKDAALETFVAKSNATAKEHGMKNVLIMIDSEGFLAAPNVEERNQAITNHMRWVQAAAALGCQAVRVNLSGTNDKEEWIRNSIAGLAELARQAAAYNINVIVENHGGFSSDAALLMQVINTINLPNCGTLPDFGNFCLESDWGGINSDCPKTYPIYQGVEEMLTKAFAVSAKSYGFDKAGNETRIDYEKMMTIVKNSGYTGFVGVEYEGEELSEPEGIQATKALLERVGKI